MIFRHKFNIEHIFVAVGCFSLSSAVSPGVCELNTVEQVFIPEEWEGNSTHVGKKCGNIGQGYLSDSGSGVGRSYLASTVHES